MLVAISAVVPSIFMIIPMVTAIIVAFAWSNDAADDKAQQSQYKGAVRNTLCFCHGWSYAAESIMNPGSLMMAIRDRLVGAVHRLSDKYLLARPSCHLAMQSACHFWGNPTSGSPIRSTH